MEGRKRKREGEGGREEEGGREKREGLGGWRREEK